MTQRAHIMKDVKRIVVKIGTASLSRKDGKLDYERIKSFADQVNILRGRGIGVILVSSGAIGAGMGELNLSKRPSRLPELQAAAAVGQGRLIAAYDAVFRERGYHAGQVLLTRADFEDRTRYLNVSDAMRALLDFGAVPVINENDTVSVEEITFSDNDILSAMVASLMRADLLVILSVSPGLYDRERRVIPVIDAVDDDIRGLATGERSRGGTGGMESKLEAAHIATSAGTPVIIAGAGEPEALPRLLDGEYIGTLFLPKRRMHARKRWIGFGTRPKGRISVDEGARTALMQGGKSLLASGITGVAGGFKRGEMVAVYGPEGSEFARGLANYSADEIEKIKGLKSSQIARALGRKLYDEVIHCDNMVVKD